MRLRQPRFRWRDLWPGARFLARGALGALELLAVSAAYWIEINPQVRRELVAWEKCARRITDPVLREHALAKLSDERLNPEAAALFAVLAPRSQRRRVVSLLVAFQILYDYLDAINEEADGAELRDGLQLHRALTEAVLPERSLSDYYLHHPRKEDARYLDALTRTCQSIAVSLPSIGECEDALARATVRCGAAQSHNHAAVLHGESPLVSWSLAQAGGRDQYLWWELAAGGIACLGVHALLACAANPRSSERDADEVDAAYFPSICALSALLDSLADYHRDGDAATHNFIAHYRDSGQAAQRLVAIASDAARGIERLPRARRHALILAGICAYYLSNDSVHEGFPAPAAESLMRHAGWVAMPLLVMMRARRRLRASGPSVPPTPEAPASPARAKR